jgi:hypothetical protein
MTTDELMKAILDKLDQVASDSKRDLADFRHETKNDFNTVRTTMTEMAVTQAKQQVILEEHIRRTEINEEELELHKKTHQTDIKDVHEKIEPLTKNIAMWAGAGKVLAVMTSLAAIAAAVVKILGH